jgi:glycosyltransferase involved in cell wall biosynthesis
MPVYNRIDILQSVVETILSQSYKNIELIIVDDCSSEDIEKVVKRLEDKRIKLIRRCANGGAAAARNTGVAVANGDYIAFHDSDDFCTVGRLDLSARALSTLPDDYIGIYGVRIFYTSACEPDYSRVNVSIKPAPNEKILSGDLSARTMHGNIINLPTLLVRKSALQACGGFDEALRQNEDWDLCLRLTREGLIGFVPTPLILTPSTLDPSVDALRVSRSVRQAARSFMRISRKIKMDSAPSQILAMHYGSTGRFLVRIGRPRAARKFFVAALQLGAEKRLWVNYFLSYTPRLYNIMRRK